MDENTASKLIELNNKFYSVNAESFSNTRQRSWDGWDKILELPQVQDCLRTKKQIKVLDYACGNLRFEKYLCERFAEKDFEFFAFDNCSDLLNSAGQDIAAGHSFENVHKNAKLHFYNIDLLQKVDACAFNRAFDDIGVVDICVCFGFFHHIPTQNLRDLSFSRIIQCASTDTIVAISFWNFIKGADAKNKHKLNTKKYIDELNCCCTEIAYDNLDDNDYILGWQNKAGQFRYCHNFDESQIQNLLSGCHTHPISEISSFTSDGKSGKDNIYKVLKVN